MHFSNGNNKHFFMCSLAGYILLLCEVLVKVFCLLLLDCLFITRWWSMPSILVLCQTYGL